MKRSRTQPPERLYKYEALTTRSLQNLKSQIIYFGSPRNFNDPYDCAFMPNITSPSDEEVEVFRAKYLRKKVPTPVRKQFEASSVQQVRDVFLRAAHSAVKNSMEELLTTKGVACFSESNDDLLMWSHYGGRYKGFCLEFSTSTEAFAKIRQVRYTPALPSIAVADLLNPGFEQVLDLFCTKSAAWAYEKEWRSIHAIAGTEYCYPPEALTGIYFGPDIDLQVLEIICLILAGQNETVRMWRGMRSTTEFRVLFEEFKYTSNLEARRKGLA